MTASTGIHRFFIVMYVLIFVGAVWTCTGWELGISTYASIPIIAIAEGIVLGMMYITIFHGAPDHVSHEVVIAPPGKLQTVKHEEMAQVLH